MATSGFAFAAAATFLEINGYSLAVSPREGYDFIYGSLDRHEFRFPKILDWIRRHIKPVR